MSIFQPVPAQGSNLTPGASLPKMFPGISVSAPNDLALYTHQRTPARIYFLSLGSENGTEFSPAPLWHLGSSMVEHSAVNLCLFVDSAPFNPEKAA
jgi:hypothetical protein